MRTQRNGPEGHSAKACLPHFRTPCREVRAEEVVAARGCPAPLPSGLLLPRPGSRESCGFVVLGVLAGLEHEAARRRQYFVFFCGCGVGGSLASCWASWSGGRGEGKRAWPFSESQKVEVEVRLRHHLDQPLGGRHRLRRGQRFAWGKGVRSRT